MYDISGGKVKIKKTHNGLLSGLPWEYIKGGKAVAGYQDLGLKYVSKLSDKEMGGGLKGDSHNAAVVDLSFLSPNTEFSSFFTIECGNDVLTGKGCTAAAVPAPATIPPLGLWCFGHVRGKAWKED